MRKIILSLTIILCAVPILNAQEIEGIVTNCGNNSETLLGVNVKVLNLINKGTSTNENGNYKLSDLREGTYEIEFSYTGMKTLTKKVTLSGKKKHMLNVCLEEEAYALEGVNITAKGERREVKEIKQQGVPVSVIDGKSLSGRGGSISEILNHQTGLKLRQTGGMGSETKINVRGLEGNRVQIYIDGHPLNTPDGSFSINDIPLQFIDRIEVYKGIVPPEFGGDGLGGAINVVTIEPQYSYFDTWYSIKSYNTHEGSATYKHYFPKQKMYLSGFVGLGYAENNYKMESPYVEGLHFKRNHDGYKKYDGALTFDFADTYFDELEFELAFYGGEKEVQGIQTDIRYAKTESSLLGVTSKLEKQGFLFEKLDMKFMGMAGFSGSQLTDTSSYQYNFDGEKYPVTGGGGEIGSVPNLSDDKLQDYRATLNLKYHIGKNFKLNLNSDFRHVRNEFNDEEADRYFTKKNNGNQVVYSGATANVTTLINSINLENNWFDSKLTSMFTLRNYFYKIKGETVNLMYGTSASLEPAEASKNSWGYSMALRYNLTHNLLAKAALEHNYRLPKNEELLGDRVTIVPSTGLRPEQANNYNIGLIYDHHFSAFQRLQLEANVYLMNIKDMMQVIVQSGYNSYYNIGKAQLSGFDVEAKWDIDKHWFVMLNGTYQKSINKTKYMPGTNTPNMSYDTQLPHIPIFYLNWMVDYRKDNLFGGKGQYTRFYYEGSYTDRYYYGAQIGATRTRVIPQADIHTLGMEYGILSRRMIFSLECHNIFDKDELTNYNYPLAGRTLQAKVRITSLKW